MVCRATRIPSDRPLFENLEDRLLLAVVTPADAADLLPAGTGGGPPDTITSTYISGEILIKLREAPPPPMVLQGGATGVLASGLPGFRTSGSLGSILASYGAGLMEPLFVADGLSASAIVAISEAGFALPQSYTNQADIYRWYRVPVAPGTDLSAAVATLAADPAVEAAELNYEYRLTDAIPYPIEGIPDSTTDPGIGQQWFLNATHTQEAWNYLRLNGVHPGGSHSVIVAVIDTGVDAAHPDLAGSMWTNPGEIPGNNIDDDHNGFKDDIHGASTVGSSVSHSGDSSDYFGHGTHVAGIIAAQGYNLQGGAGVAFNVQIMSIRAAQYSGVLTVDDIAEAVVYAINKGAEVINMSFGGYQRSQVVEDALAMALNQAVLVAAAGNDQIDIRQYPFYPAALPYVHGVMATTRDDFMAWFTNTGYDMRAPGEGIYSTLPGNQYASWSGTSMAAPVVSGIAALMRSYFWQRDVYSSRFLMGALYASQFNEYGGLTIPINAYRALTIPPKPGVVMLNTWLFDDTGIAAGNDADGRADAGETLNIAIEVINRSGQADNVVGTLRAHAQGAVFDDPYVTITTPTVDFGSIGPFATKDNGFIYDAQGVIVGVQQPFVFTVSPDCPNDHIIPFELTTTFRNGWDPDDETIYTRVSRFEFIVQRGQNVPTVIAAGTTLTLTADQFWIVGGPVLVEPGATLNIAAGAQVQWGAISSDPYNPGPKTGSLVVRGTLTVQGTAENPASLFPSYLVSGQTTNITVDGGRATLSYAKVRNPNLSGIWTIDHCYFDRDAYNSAISAQVISNSVFHKLKGASGVFIDAYRFENDLFDESQIRPKSGAELLNCVFLQDNESGVPLSLFPPLSFSIPMTSTTGYALFGGIHTYNGFTYVALPMEFTSLRLAETIANYYGGHVTSIADAEEAAVVGSCTSTIGSPHNYIIGLTDEGTPGTYRWLDGTPLDYTNWQAGYPVALSPGTFHVVYRESTGWTNGTQTKSTRYGNGTAWEWYNFVLRLPGTLTMDQLTTPFDDGTMNAFVRANYPEEVSRNAFLNKYWDPNVSHWMRINGSANASTGYAIVYDNFWGTTTPALVDYAILDYYDNFTSARVEYGTLPAHGYESTWPFVESVLINGAPADTVPTVGSGPTTYTITFNRDMDPTVQPYVTFGPSVPHTDFSVNAIGQVEALFDVALSAPCSRPVTVDYQTIDGTARAGIDYEAAGGTLTFQPGQTRLTVRVPVLGDIWEELDKQFSLRLSNPTVVEIADAEADGAIVDDDALLAIGDVQILEGDGESVSAVFTVTLSKAASETVTVDFATVETGWAAARDYQPVSGTLTFLPGELQKSIAVPVIGNARHEADRTFLVNLTHPTIASIADNQAVGTILDDDPEITIGDVSLVEGSDGTADAVFTVTLSAPPTKTINVDYATADGSALAGQDYQAASGRVTFTAGGPAQQTITVHVLGNSQEEWDEAFVLDLSGLAGGVIVDGHADATIIDDDGLPLVSIGDVSVVEGDDGTTEAVLEVHLSYALGRDVVVQYATADGTATAGSDYTAQSGLATIPAGETSVTVRIPVTGDANFELDESFTVNLISSGDYLAMAPAQSSSLATYPYEAATADFNGDGRPDMAFACATGAASILLNTTTPGANTATFSARQDFTSGSSCHHLAIGDLNGDGRPDLVVSNNGANTVSVFLNSTAAGASTVTFSPKQNLASGTKPWQVVIADLNGDARPDIAVANETSGSVSTWVNNTEPGAASGSFGSRQDITFAAGCKGFAVTDINADGLLDLVVTNQSANLLSVAMGTTVAGAGVLTFAPKQDFTTPASPQYLTVCDLDGDGRPDLAEGNSSANSLSTFLNRTEPLSMTAALTRQDFATAAKPRVVQAGDFNGDGRTDLAMSFEVTNGEISVFLNTTLSGSDAVTLAPASQFGIGAANSTTGIAVADFNADGRQDMAVANLGNTGSVFLNTSAFSGYKLIGSQATVTILEDETAQLAITGGSVPEGDSGTTDLVFTVTLAESPASPVTVGYQTVDGSAVAGQDYQAAAGTLTFLPGGPLEQTITVHAIGDTAMEADKNFTVRLSDAAGAEATGTIQDDDAPVITIDDLSVWEGDSGQAQAAVTIRLSKEPVFPVTVDYVTAGGSATAYVDFQPVRGSVVWQPGEPLVRTILVPIIGDALDEGDETFLVDLMGVSQGVIADGQAVVTILDDEPTLSIGDARIVEGDDGTTDAVFTVRLASAPERAVVVNFATADGSATAGADYQAVTGTLTFEPGQPTEQTIAVPVFGDTDNETNETFVVALSGASGAKIADGEALGTIVGDDGPLVSIEDAGFIEGDSGTANRAFTVRISADPSQRVIVHYHTEDGTAAAGVDYGPVDATVVFDPGQPLEQTILVPIRGDTASEGDETFSVVLTSATVVGISDDRAAGTIANDDPLVSIDDVSLVEGVTGFVEMTFTVSISMDPPDIVTLTWATVGQTATEGTDYLAASGALTFLPGGPRQQTVTVTVMGDVANEVHETFRVQLANLVNANFAKDRGVGTITDDDGPKIIIGDASMVEGDAGTANATFTVSLTEPTTEPITINWATQNGTGDAAALAGPDYTAAGGTLTFLPGEATSQQVTVQVKGDQVDEVDETFLVQLSGAAGAPVLDAAAEGTILDNDTATLSVGDVTVAEGYNGWLNSRTWQGSFYTTPVTGEGYQLMRISGAVAADDPWLVSGYDVGRYRFQVKTMGVASMNLQAVGQEGSVRLSWQQNDYDLLAGYNLYRSTSLTGTYAKINSVLITEGNEFFVDTAVTPAVPMYYKFTVVTTDMTESDYSNVASAAAVDTVPAVVTHTPVTSARPSQSLPISATVTDNVGVQGVTLNYRPAGSGGDYTSLPMVNVSGTSWVATIPGSAVLPPGVEYYLAATDGISQTYSGTPAAPHTVVVTNAPTLNSAGPNVGPITGGTTVSLSGTMFQPGASVHFGTAPAGNVVVLADNQITCTTPSHIPEMVDITVTNPDGTSATLLHGFTFVDQGVVVSLPAISGDSGALIEVPISVSNVNGLTAADLRITFTSGILSAQSVRVGNLTAGWVLSANTATPGTVTISMASATAVAGSGVVAIITFRVNGAPTTQTPLTVASALLNDGAITCALSPGNFTVNGLFNVAGSVTYFTGGGPVPGVDLSLVGVGVQSASSATNGAFAFAGVPTGSYVLTPAKNDDADQITAYDASLILQSAAGMLTLTANQRVAADVNDNGLITAMDASYILQKSVGLLDGPFPGAGTVWGFVPESRSYSLLNSNQTGQNFTAVLLGDVSGNWVYVPGGSGQSLMGPLAGEEAGASLTLPVVEAASAQRIVVPLQIDPDGADVYSADLVLTYDPAALSLAGVNVGGAAADMGYAFNTSQPGTVRAGFAGAQPMAAGGTLMELVFDVVGTLQTPAVVSLASAELNEGQVDAAAQDGLIRDTIAPATGALCINGITGRGAGAVDPSGAGIRQIAVGFTEAVNFAGGVLVQKVTFVDGQEVLGETVEAVLIGGSGSTTMTLALPPAAALDTWLKVTLNAGSIADPAGNALAGGIGGAASFYIGSLRGDFTGDLSVGPDDLAAFAAAWGAMSPDADFRGVGFGVRPPDGRITASDIDGFNAVYQRALAMNLHLDELPVAGSGQAAGFSPLASGPLPTDSVDIRVAEADPVPSAPAVPLSGAVRMAVQALSGEAPPTGFASVFAATHADSAAADEPDVLGAKWLRPVRPGSTPLRVLFRI